MLDPTRIVPLVFLLLVAPAARADDPWAAIQRCDVPEPGTCPAVATLLKDGPAAVAAVVSALRSDEQRSRYAAARLVGRSELGDPATQSATLLKALAETPDPVRGETLNALGRLETTDAAAALVAALKDGATDARNRVFAAQALDGKKGDAVRLALETALEDPVPQVQQAAATSLRDPAAIPALIRRALSEKTAGFVRQAAALSLGAIGDVRALPVLVVLLGCPNELARRGALMGLARLKDTTAALAITSLVRDPAVGVDALDALAALGASEAADAVGAVAADPTAALPHRLRALAALARLQGAKASPGVVAVLTANEAELARAAAECLGQLADPTTAPALVAAFDRKDAELNRTLFWALKAVTGKDHGLDPDAWRAAIAAPPKSP